MYKSDCVALSAFGDMEQLLMECIVQSIDIDLSRNRPIITHGVAVMELHSSRHHSQFTPEHISKIWNVGIGMAKDILATTTQKGI
jgi:hypothetical protein